MSERSTAPITISLGGSLIVPSSGQPDTDFLQQFCRFVREEAAGGRQFVIVTGGGNIAREYQDAYRAVADEPAEEDLDWLGIYATRYNARLLQHLLADIAHRDIAVEPSDIGGVDASVIVGAGSVPGHSSDLGTVQLAVAAGASDAVNLSGARYVYPQDPDTHPDAEPYADISWAEYLDIIPAEWSPGLSVPFDPVAARFARDHELRVAIAGGDLSNVERYVRTGELDGTRIHP